jgi:hypothetical protein
MTKNQNQKGKHAIIVSARATMTNWNNGKNMTKNPKHKGQPCISSPQG